MTPNESRRRTIRAYRKARRSERLYLRLCHYSQFFLSDSIHLDLPDSVVDYRRDRLHSDRLKRARYARAACNLAAHYHTLED